MGIISLAKSRLISKAAPYLLVLIAALVSIFLLTRSDPRFHLIALGWFGVCVLNAGVCKGSAAKLLWINGGFFFFLFGTAEFYLRVSQTPSRPPTSQEGTKSSLMRPDDLLGYAPKANMTVSDRMLRGGELIWDVIYTIDEHGLRVTPRPKNPTECVLFFGGSFAFGSGLNDEETMAYQVGIKAPENLRVYNFGVGGYGAHQMLSAIEHDVVANTIDCEPESVKQVVYQGIWQHAARVAGIVPWDDHGPRYGFDEDGMVNYQGHFDDGPLKTWRTINKRINKSYIYQHITGSGKYFRRVDGSDLDLYVSVIARTRTLIQARYPCAKFDVLFWDTDANETTGILERFSAQGFLPHRVSTILPNFGDAEEGLIYKIHPQDGHPNALANERISDYVVETILPDGASCGRSGVDP